jgi:hypothetical protein
MLVIKRISLMSILLLLLASIIGCSESAKSLSPVDFYKGKTVNLITNSSSGGFDDLVSHVIASYLSSDTSSNVVLVNKSVLPDWMELILLIPANLTDLPCVRQQLLNL